MKIALLIVTKNIFIIFENILTKKKWESLEKHHINKQEKKVL